MPTLVIRYPEKKKTWRVRVDAPKPLPNGVKPVGMRLLSRAPRYSLRQTAKHLKYGLKTASGQPLGLGGTPVRRTALIPYGRAIKSGNRLHAAG